MHLRHLCLLWVFVPLAIQAQEPQPSESRRSFDVLSIVLHSDRMQFVVRREKGHAANGTPLYPKSIVSDDHRVDLVAAAQKLSEGRKVAREFRTFLLADPMVEFYVGDNRVLRLDQAGDRVICSSKDASIDLFFGEEGVKGLKDLFDGFTKANQSPEPTPGAVH